MVLRLLIILAGITICNCKSAQQITIIPNKEINGLDFSLLDATYEHWSSGIRGGQKGTDYFFKLVVLTPDRIVFDSVWMQNHRYPVIVTKAVTVVSNQALNFACNDTVILKISDIQYKAVPATIPPPIEYEGSALIRYTKVAVTKYFAVKEIKEKVSPNRQ